MGKSKIITDGGRVLENLTLLSELQIYFTSMDLSFRISIFRVLTSNASFVHTCSTSSRFLVNFQ